MAKKLVKKPSDTAANKPKKGRFTRTDEASVANSAAAAEENVESGEPGKNAPEISVESVAASSGGGIGVGGIAIGVLGLAGIGAAVGGGGGSGGNPPPAVDGEATGTLSVTGVAAEGRSLTALLSNATDTDGSIASISYQWQRQVSGAWTNIVGGDSATLTIPADQSFVGATVRVVATTTDAKSNTTTFTGSEQVIANVDDVATGSLAVTGAALEGGSLTAALTGVSDADGATTTAYQWQKFEGGAWVAISGGNSATLSIPSDQSLVDVPVRVVATTTDAL
ncbi:hypothetical protein, partial [Sphingorhabdus wooponensis]